LFVACDPGNTMVAKQKLVQQVVDSGNLIKSISSYGEIDVEDGTDDFLR